MVLLGGIAAPEEVRLGREMVGTGAGIMPGTTCSKARFRTGMICSLKQMRLKYFFLSSLLVLSDMRCSPGVWSICQQVVEELRVLSFQLFSALLGLGQLKGFHQRLVHLHLKLLRVGSLRLLR